MARNTISLKLIIIILLTMLFITLSYAMGIDEGFLAIISLWLISVEYCAMDVKRHLITLCFLLTFFIFLLGAYFSAQYFNYTEHVVFFNKEITRHIYIALFVALAGLMTGEITYFKKREGFRSGDLHNESYANIIKNVSKLFYFVTLIPYFITEFVHVAVSQTQGYTGLYLIDSSSVLPFWFRLIAYICPICLYLFLATMPSKKEAKGALLLYFTYTVLTLLSGQRSYFVINIMLIFIYCYFRNQDEDGEIWLSRRTMIALAIFAPIAMILLNMVGYTRFNTSSGQNSIFYSFLDTLTSQGVSISVVGYEKYYEDSIPDKLYSLGGTIEFLKNNPIASFLFDYPVYSGQNPERAMNGNLFSHLISYFVLPWGYEHGQGLGSSYVAETYHDFGYLGVFIASFIYGKIIKTCNYFNTSSIAVRFIMLIMLYALLMAPRGLTDAFISSMLTIQVIAGVIIIIGVSNLVYYQRKRLGVL